MCPQTVSLCVSVDIHEQVSRGCLLPLVPVSCLCLDAPGPKRGVLLDLGNAEGASGSAAGELPHQESGGTVEGRAAAGTHHTHAMPSFKYYENITTNNERFEAIIITNKKRVTSIIPPASTRTSALFYPHRYRVAPVTSNFSQQLIPTPPPFHLTPCYKAFFCRVTERFAVVWLSQLVLFPLL